MSDMYVDRNEQGDIIAAYNRPQFEGQEIVSHDDAELIAFLKKE